MSYHRNGLAGSLLSLSLGALLAGSCLTAAFAQDDIASIWEGKTITLVVSQGPGGGHDTAARLIAPHLAEHIPGHPDIIVENMPGGSHRVATNHVYASAPDGLTLQLLNFSVPGYQLAGEGEQEGVRFDVTKMCWIGSPGVEIQVLVMTKESGVTPQTLNLLTEHEFKLANEAAGGGPHRIAAVLELGLGWKFENIFGYEGQDRDLAMERGEVDGEITVWDSVRGERADEIASGRWVPIVTLGSSEPNTGPLQGVPTATELFAAQSEEAKRILAIEEAKFGWPRALVGPPGMDPAACNALRQAFMETMQDPELLADAEKIQFNIDPVPGDVLEQRIATFMAMDRTAMDKIQAQVDAESQ
jgi:tripartite-type tricarboxylate transporter receptor subunit TctC